MFFKWFSFGRKLKMLTFTPFYWLVKLQKMAIFLFVLLGNFRPKGALFQRSGKILDLVSVFRDVKKRAQNRNANGIVPCIEDIAIWMSKIVIIE